MGTRSIIAANIGGKVEGRYVHWDGYPSGVGRALAVIVKRDGLEQAIKTLLLDHARWSSLNAEDTQHTDFGVAVPGYGVANHDDKEDDWFPVGDNVVAEMDAEWAYVLEPAGDNVYIQVYKTLAEEYPNQRWHWFDRVTLNGMIYQDAEGK